MSLLDLKKIAKERKIKQYYIMKRIQLIELLSKETLPEQYIIEKKTIRQLREEAKDKNMTGFWGLNREQLVELLYPSTKKQNHHNNNAKEHNHPEKGDTK